MRARKSGWKWPNEWQTADAEGLPFDPFHFSKSRVLHDDRSVI
eukprot:COSAG02_NODE_1789_length_10924_cov_4.791224_5_plen_43_part_00